MPLKSGGWLSLGWHRFSGVGYDTSLEGMAVGTDGWLPAGRGSLFSFLPFLAQTPDGIRYRRYAERGSAYFYQDGSPVGDVTYFKPATPLAYSARYTSGSKYFTEYDPNTGTSHEYGGYGHPLEGRLLRRWDRNGNELVYHYAQRDPNPSGYAPILRKITGDVSSVTPYFQYASESDAAPVTKLYLSEGASPGRTVYYDYQGTTAKADAFLSRITNPNGCVVEYGLVDSGDGQGATAVHKEVDQEGYVTYYEYLDEDLGFRQAIRKAVEPEERVTYFGYGELGTEVVPKDRPPAYFGYQLTGVENVADTTQVMDALGNRTRYDYTAQERIRKQVGADGGVMYYEYNDEYSRTQEVRGADGATKAYVYQPNGYDVHKELGPRHVAGSFPVVTYYEYDENRRRVVETDVLGNAKRRAWDSAGQIWKEQDEAGNTTYFNYADETGNQVSQVDAAGAVSYYDYNAYRARTREVSPRWEETGSYAAFTSYYEYDNLNRKTKAIDALGRETSFDYTGRGDLMAETDPRGVVKEKGYDGLRLLRKDVVLDAAEAVVQVQYYEYDTYKNRVRERDGAGNWSYHFYDEVNRQKARRDAAGNHTYYFYDAVGHKTKERDARLNTTYYFYDSRELLKAQRDALGAWTYFYYDLADNREKSRDARLVTTYYFYEALNRQRAQRDALGNHAYYFYDAVGNRTQERDALLNTTYHFYDALNRQKAQRDALANHTYYFYDAAGNRTKERDARLNTTYHSYDAVNKEKAQRDALGNQTYYFYDAVGNRTRERDARLYTTYHFYDELNRQKAQRDALANHTYYSYDAAGNRTKDRNARLYTTYYFYDAVNRQRSQRDALGHQTYYYFDEVGNQAKVKDARLNTSYFFYDALNRQKAQRDTLGNHTYYYFDEVGNQSKVLNALLNTTYHFYDDLNRRKTQRDALANHTYYFYDAVGNQTKVRDARLNTTYYFYDALNRRSETRDPLGNSTAFGYDEVGNQHKVVSPRGYSTYYEYDAVNRQAALVDAEGERTGYGYDANGNRARLQNAIECTTYYEYDALNRLAAVASEGYGLQSYGNSPYGGGPVIQFGYDAVGNRRVEVDGNGSLTYYAYDALNRLSGVTDPLGVSDAYQYDEVSNLRKTVDNKGTAVYFGYDALNRRTRIDYPAEAQDFEYDAVGNMTAVEDEWGRSEFKYDALSRMASHTTPYGDAVYYAYDNDSNLIRLQYPRGTASCYYSYDAANRMTSALSPDDHQCDYAHDSSSNIIRKRFGNGAVAYYTYDKAERVSSIRHVKSDGTPIVYFDYARDAAGRITRIGREGDLAIYYEYDSIDRLTGEVWRRRSDSGQIYGFWYDYDLAGNRTQMRREFGAGVEWESAYYVYGAANALTKRQVMPDDVTTYYKYDLNGSLTKEYDGTDATYYDYGPHGLITQITPPPASGNPWRFYYDGKLNRYKMDKGGTIGYFVWDGMNLLEERDSTGAIVAKYTHGETPIKGIGSVVEAKRITPTTTYFHYLHMDHRGTVHAVTDIGQVLTASYATDAPGRELGILPNISNCFRYQANWMSIVINSKAVIISPVRIYDVLAGRFTQIDQHSRVINIALHSTGNTLGLAMQTILEVYAPPYSIASDTDNPQYHVTKRHLTLLFINNSVLGTNNYVFVNGNPVEFTDPTGLITKGRSCCTCDTQHFVPNGYVGKYCAMHKALKPWEVRTAGICSDLIPLKCERSRGIICEKVWHIECIRESLATINRPNGGVEHWEIGRYLITWMRDDCPSV